jgi:hypothetical protein
MMTGKPLQRLADPWHSQSRIEPAQISQSVAR